MLSTLTACTGIHVPVVKILHETQHGLSSGNQRKGCLALSGAELGQNLEVGKSLP